MEVSSSDPAESDSFFAVNTMAESQEEPLSQEDELFPLKPYPPLILLFFIDFLDPIALISCSLSTKSIIGIVYLILLIFHILVCKHLKYNFFRITFIISLEIMLTLVILILAIFSVDDPESIKPLQIAGIYFEDRSLTLACTIISVIFQGITIALIKNTSIDLFIQKRIDLFQNPYFTFFIDFFYSFSIAFIASTTTSDPFFLLLIYYIYLNLCFVFCGREIICRWIKIFLMVYSVIYSVFQFYMISYVGSLIMPTSGDIWFAFIGTEKAKTACFIFSALLIWTSMITLTNMEMQFKNTTIFVLPNITIALISILFTCVAIFASFFPNYLSVLYLIIIFFSTFAHHQIIFYFFYPFLAFIFILSFVISAVTQYGKFGHPEDNGTEQYYSFIKLFGLYKYESSNRFTFCWTGFMIFASFGQIGRIKFVSLHNSKRKKNFDIHREANSSDNQERGQNIIIFIRNFAISFEQLFLKLVKIAHKIVYILMMYFLLPACIIIGIYAGYFKDKWSFQILSFLVMIIVLLFLYYQWPFQVLKFFAGVIIIICAFYQSSDSYYCRGQKRCLFYGYFDDIERSGLCPPPTESLIHYCWPVYTVFVLSLFLASDKKYLRTNYPSIIIVFLYFIVSICDLVYAFKYKLSIFSIFYFFIGCFIFTFQALECNAMRTLMIMLNFIAVSVQLSIYIIVRHDDMRNFFMSHVSSKIIDIGKIKDAGDTEIILLALMLFFSSISFHGPQRNQIHTSIKYFIQFIRQVSYYSYYDLSSLCFFGLSIANNYPSFIKFLFLFFVTFCSLIPRFFFRCRIVLIIIMFLFIITQYVFHSFVKNDSKDFLETFRYIGFYFTDKELDNFSTKVSLGWQFGFLLISLLNAPSATGFKLSDDFEQKKIIQVFRSLSAFIHFMLQPITKIVMFICASYNSTIFCWFLYYFMAHSAIDQNFFYKVAPFLLFFIQFYLLAQYLLYLGFPDSILNRNWDDPINMINQKHRKVVGEWFEFFGIYHIRISSLITTYASALSLTIYHHFYKVQVDYQLRYESLPSLLKAFVEYGIQNIFKICITFILILAALSKKPDGVFLFVLGSVFFAATILFNYNLISSRSVIQSYIYVITFLRILSRLPVFIDNEDSNFVIRLFDLPLRGTSSSTGYWIVIFALLEICCHVQHSDLYQQLSLKKAKRQAYRFIRDRQIKIIEKLDQAILLCKRKQEINLLLEKRQENLQQEIDLSESNIFLINANTDISIESMPSSENDNFNDNTTSVNSNTTTPPSSHNNNSETNNNNDNNNTNTDNNNNNNNNNENNFDNINDLSDSYISSDISMYQCDDISMKPKEEKWYHRFYYSWVEPQVIRLTRILATSLPVNKEMGINVLTLESLTILMRRCLNHYEKNKDFHLEEREKQFLLALPPSFAYHFSSIFHLIDYRPLFDQKPIELLVRYLCLFLKNFSLALLVLISTIYLFLKPYIYSTLVFAFIIFIFCSTDFSELPNVYLIFFISVTIILGLQSAANTDLIYERLKTVKISLTNIQSTLSALSLIGIEPDSSPAIEVLLFLSSIYFIAKQIDSINVFPATFYFEKFSGLNGFPVEYCYGIMDDPVRNLGMKTPQGRSLVRMMKAAMNRVWVQSTVHHNFILFINALSFIVLLSSWNNWEDNSGSVSSSDKHVFGVTEFFIFIMIIDLVFQLTVYFCCLNNLYFILFWIELIWLLYSFSMLFFFIRSNVSSLGKAGEFYIFLRVIQHIIAAHICFIGRTNISYRSLDFARDWRIILFSDNFLRYFPFVFEIQSILMWIGRKTLISFHNFLVVRTIEVQLEIAICKKIDKNNSKNTGAKPKLRSNKLKGTCYLFLLICAVFIPILFWYDSDSDYVANSILFAKIEAGVSSLPPFYETLGTVRKLYESENIIISENPNKQIRSLLTQPRNSLFLIDFPLFSYSPFQLSQTAFDIFAQNVINKYTNYEYYIKYTLYFEHPATVSGKIKCQYLIQHQLNQSQLNNAASAILYFMMNNNSNNNNNNLMRPPFNDRDFTNSNYSFFDEEISNIIPCDLGLSHIFTVISTNTISPFEFSTSSFNFFAGEDSFAINISSYQDVSFLNSTKSYKIIVSSAHILEDLNMQTLYRLSGGDGFTGIYTLLIIVLGISIREIVFKRTDSVWRNRIQKPLVLYKMIVEINMFKNANDIKTEKELCDKFLDLLRIDNPVVNVEKDEITENKEKAD